MRKLKNKYTLIYVAFQALPVFLIIIAIGSAIIFMADRGGTKLDLTLSVVAVTVSLFAFFIYYGYRIIKFLKSVNSQERKYGVYLDDSNAKTLGNKFSVWLLCAEKWLIYPGRFAIHRSDIKSASVGEQYLEGRKLIITPVRIKTHSGKTYIIKLRREDDARYLRKWAKKGT